MSNSSRVRTIRIPLRKICSTLPAMVMIGGGIVFSASAAPTVEIRSGAATSSSPAIVVPDVALTWPPSPGGSSYPSRLVGPMSPELEAPAPSPLAPMLPAGTIAGSSVLVTLDSAGIPVRALESYRQAATLTDAADPACHIDWALLAAIGRVESNHARFGGNQLDSAGVAQPGIFGIPLDGSNGTARITDSDGGLLDRDTVYDRAVGPMQFIPSTWRVDGVDADGDGVKNPQDMTDAATASAIYLCSGPGDLSRPDDLRSAILRYNNSDSYVQLVTNIASAYRQGVRALPASDLPPVKAAPSTPGAASATGPAAAAVPGAPIPARSAGTAPTTAAPGTAAPTKTASSTAVPTTTTTSTAVPTTAVPTTAAPTTPTTAVPTTTTTSTTAVPTTTTSTTAEPCVPIPDPTISDPTTPTATTTATATATATGVPCPSPTSTTSSSAPAPTAPGSTA
jgi:hypothetical protein